MHSAYALCLLAGGQARRMGGGDKGEISLDGKTIISRLLGRFDGAAYQFINANGDAARFAHYGLDVISDRLEDYQGPLAGIYSALCHVRDSRPDIKWLLSLPTDAPFIPEAIIDEMLEAGKSAPIISVKSNGRTHPVIALWSVEVIDALHDALFVRGDRKIDIVTAPIGCRYLEFEGEPDPFLNLNRPDDLKRLEAQGSYQIDLAFLENTQ